MLSLWRLWAILQNQLKREVLQESLLTCFLVVKAVRHQPARESLKSLFIPSLQVSKLLSLLNFQLDSEICVFLEIIFFSICYIWMIFEFLKAAMPTPLRNPDKYEIFSSYADIYRLLELSGDADNLTRTFFFYFVQPGLCWNPFKFRPTIWPCDHQVAIMRYNLWPIKLRSGRFSTQPVLKKKKKLKHNSHLISSCIYEAIFHIVFPLPYLGLWPS